MSDLRAAAMAATPGPWFSDHGKIGHGAGGIGEMDEPSDAEYIAAASPDRILALLDTNERQAARIVELEAALMLLRHMTYQLHPSKAVPIFTVIDTVLAPGTGEAG